MSKPHRIIKLLGQPGPYKSVLLKNPTNFTMPSKRYFSIVPILSRVLKLRYIFLGSAVGGGIAIQNKYEDLKSQMPDISWMKQFMSDEAFERVTNKMKDIYEIVHPQNMVEYFLCNFDKFKIFDINFIFHY